MTTAAALVEQIEARARELRPARVALVVVAVPFLVIGVAAGLVARGAWVVISWAIATTIVAYQAAGGPQRGRVR